MGPLKRPFGQAAAILVAAYLLFKFGIPHLPPLFGVRSAPAPSSVILEYMAVILVGVLLFVSSDEERWSEFKRPIREVFEDPQRKVSRGILLTVVPLVLGFLTLQQVVPSLAAPGGLRVIHPPPPTQITFEGQPMVLAEVVNPLREDGSIEEDLALGKEVYYQNCLPCHGDGLDGRGHYADGLNPAPLNFQDNGTIAQLTESFVFWRIAKGGPGLPNESQPHSSAMPAWEGILSADEIWSVIIFLYEQTGWTPRTWDEEGGEGDHG